MKRVPLRIVRSLFGSALCLAFATQVQAQCQNPVCFPGEPCPQYRCPPPHRFGNLSVCHIAFSSAPAGGVAISFVNNFSGATCANSTIFYTVDGSPATEASIEYTGPVTLPQGAPGINSIAVETSTTDANGNVTAQAVIAQDGESTWNSWDTVIVCPQSGCPSFPGTPNLKNGGGVSGTPSDIYFLDQQTSTHPPGSPTTGNFNFATNSGPTQTLWPFSVSLGPQINCAGSTGCGCDTCNTLVEDFYLWPEYDSSANPADVQDWESDMVSWILQPNEVQAGGSLQCDATSGWGFDYPSSATSPSWSYSWPIGPTTAGPITQDCVGNLPFGTIPAVIGSSDTTFSVTPNGSNSLEPGMILRIDDEEIMCTAVSSNQCTNAIRGWAGSNGGIGQPHNQGTPWMGSVHVQYHMSLYPGNEGCPYNGMNNAVDCAFIDYLTLNNVQYDFDANYNNGSGTQTNTGTYLGVPVPVPPGPYSVQNGQEVYYDVDRVFNQFQMDIPQTVSSAAEVGEYIDQDNVTASWGVEATASCAASSCP